jgi:predicted XRE-type DNA-binding protein
LGISQPRLNDVLNGKIDKFSLDALVNLSAAARLEVDICFASGPLQWA